MATIIKITIIDSINKLKRVSYIDTEPESIKVLVNDKVVYLGKKYNPSAVEKTNNGKSTKKKKNK